MDLPAVRYLIVASLLSIGVIQCFYGYRMFKFILGLTGFVGGGVLAGGLAFTISRNVIVVVLTGLVGGSMGALLMVAGYFVGLFTLGAIFGALAGSMLFAVAGSIPEPVVLLLLAVIGGIVALIVNKPMIILSTGFWGAGNIVAAMASLAMGTTDLSTIESLLRSGGGRFYTLMLSWLLLGIAGVIVQYKTAPAKREIA